MMVENEEIPIFLNELVRLIEEYQKCQYPMIKEQIYDTILLLTETLRA